MRQYKLISRKSIELLHDVPRPEPVDDQVLIKVKACSVCNRSDLVYFHYLGLRDHCSNGCFGHEISGVVEKTGPAVKGFKPGDRVFVRTPLTSGYADYALARELALGRLPVHIPFEQGSVLQLLPLAVHATRGVKLGNRVLIIGQGPVGLMALQVVKLRGASQIHTLDVDQWRLGISKVLGANSVTLMERDDHCCDFAKEYERTFDVAIDAVGTPNTIKACCDAVGQGGVVVTLGTHHIDSTVSFNLINWEYKGIVVHSSAEPIDIDRILSMRTAQRLVDHDQIKLTPLITHQFSLEELPKAIDKLSQSRVLYTASDLNPPYPGPPPEVLKIVICP